MKRIFKDLLSIIFYLFIFTNVFIYKNNIFEYIDYSITLFLEYVFPFLFITIIIEEMIIKSNLIYYICKLIQNIKFINPLKLFIILFSILGGCPTNIILIKNLLDKNIINTNEANNLLECTYFSNILFLINILSVMFNNYEIVYKIIISHYLSNILIITFKKIENKSSIKYLSKNTNKTNLSGAINKSINTNLMVFGTIVYFIVISNIINMPFPYLFINTLISGFLEITQGLIKLNIVEINLIIKEIIAIAFISFGGLSIHVQSKSILKDANLSYKSFLKGRVISVLISISILLILTLF